MKFKNKKQSRINWKKVAIVVVLVGIAAYQWYSENRSFNGTPVVDVDEYYEKYESSDASKTTATTGNTPAKRLNSKPSVTKTSPEVKTYPEPTPPKNREQEYLKAIGGGKLQSPEGLIYAKGRGGEHRVDHVMRHIRDDPTRPVHGVFKGDRESVLKLIDEAYGLIKDKSKYVKSEKSQGNTAYTVSMGKKVGYEGGQKGQRNGNRELRKIRLVLDGNKVITAYPYR